MTTQSAGVAPFRDDLLPWLTEMLACEREAISEQLRTAVNAHLEQRHVSVLAAIASRMKVDEGDEGDTKGSLKAPEVEHPAPQDSSDERKAPHAEAPAAKAEETVLPHHPFIAGLLEAFQHFTKGDGHSPDEELMETAKQKLMAGKKGLKVDPHSEKHYKSKALREMAGDRDDGTSHSPISLFVHSNHFEVICGVIIFSCTLVMVAEVQYNGLTSGYHLEVENYLRPAYESWPGAEATFGVLGVLFNLWFTVELTLRFWAYKWKSLRMGWMYFDSILVFLGLLDVFGLLNFGMDPMLLRLARLLRMVRLVKLVKAIKAFETLFLLVRSIQASMGALIWSFLLLCFVQLATGILLCQLLRAFIDNPQEDIEVRNEVFMKFGTFTNAMITMFEISLANWVPVARLLYFRVNHWYGGILIVFRCCFMFGMIKVITAIFIAETNRCANSDDNIAVAKKQRLKEAYCLKLREIFEELDDSGDGLLSWAEFEPLVTDELLRTWLSTLDIDTQELESLFQILDTGDGKIDVGEFTRGMSRVRGPAKSIDVLKIITNLGQISGKLDTLNKRATMLGFSPEPDAVDAQAQRLQQIDTKLDEVLRVGSRHMSLLESTTSADITDPWILARTCIPSSLPKTPCSAEVPPSRPQTENVRGIRSSATAGAPACGPSVWQCSGSPFMRANTDKISRR